MTCITKCSNNQRLGSAFNTGRISLADFHLLSLAKINIFKKKKSDPDVLQAYVTQSQNPRQYFPVLFGSASTGHFYNYIKNDDLSTHCLR